MLMTWFKLNVYSRILERCPGTVRVGCFGSETTIKSYNIVHGAYLLAYFLNRVPEKHSPEGEEGVLYMY